MKKLETLTFKKFCMTIGNLPSSYVESLSYYECLMWLCNYLQTEVIPTVNNNSEAVEELQGLFIQLQQYVYNYFDNLDVQEEINNKLDDMVEQGTLQEIIADYLNSKAVFGFDTVADMVSATNLIEGSYAKTLGYYELNDGGSATYKIRNITNEDVVDGGSIIAMEDETLVAEAIIDEVHTKQFGCYGDETHDDTIQFNNAISFAETNQKILIIDTGVYKVNGLEINDTIIMKGKGNESVISLNSTSDSNGAIVINDSGFKNSNFIDFKIICNYATNASGIYARPTTARANNKLVINNVNIYDSNKHGIDIYPDNQTRNIGTEISNLKVCGCKKSGINIKGTDLVLNNIISYINQEYGINAIVYSTKMFNIKCYQNGKGDYTTLEDNSRIDPEATGTYYKKYAGINLDSYNSTYDQIDVQENGGDGIYVTGYNNSFTNLNLDNNGYLNAEADPYTPISYESVDLIPIYYGVYFTSHNMIQVNGICSNLRASVAGRQQKGGYYFNSCKYVTGSLNGGTQYNGIMYEYSSSDCDGINLIINGSNKGLDFNVTGLILPTNYTIDDSKSYIEKIGSNIHYHLIIKKSTGYFVDGDSITGLTSTFRPSQNTFIPCLGSDNNGWGGYDDMYCQFQTNGTIVIKTNNAALNYLLVDKIVENR